VTGLWFSQSILVSSKKTDRHDITETLLKVTLNTITLTPIIIFPLVVSEGKNETSNARKHKMQTYDIYFASKYALYILYKCRMNYVPLFKHTANYRGKIAYIIRLNPIYLLTLEMKLSRGEGWDATNRFNTGTCLCLSQARTWISNVIYCGLFCVQ
jgi:hypothetical protein